MRAYPQQHLLHGGARLQVLGGQDEHVGGGGAAHLRHHVAGHGALAHLQQQVGGQPVEVGLQQVVREGHRHLHAAQLLQHAGLVVGLLLHRLLFLFLARLAGRLLAAGLSALLGLEAGLGVVGPGGAGLGVGHSVPRLVGQLHGAGLQRGLAVDAHQAVADLLRDLLVGLADELALAQQAALDHDAVVRVEQGERRGALAGLAGVGVGLHVAQQQRLLAELRQQAGRDAAGQHGLGVDAGLGLQGEGGVGVALLEQVLVDQLVELVA